MAVRVDIALVVLNQVIDGAHRFIIKLCDGAQRDESLRSDL